MTSRECELVADLLPWHANGTLGAADREIVEAHVALCAECQTTLALERRIVESVRAPRGNVEQSPHAGWQKLAAEIDAGGTSKHGPHGGAMPGAAPPSSVSNDPVSSHGREISARPAQPRARRRLSWAGILGIAVAVQAAAIAVMAVALLQNRRAAEQPRFRTLSSEDPTLAFSGALVRIAFDPAVHDDGARDLARQVGGRVIAGPSPENVYTFAFAAAGTGDIEQKVQSLRRQEHVLLVERVDLGTASEAR